MADVLEVLQSICVARGFSLDDLEKVRAKKFENRGGFEDYSLVIRVLFEFALKDLIVIRNTHSGMITANFLLPIAFRIENNKVGWSR